MKTQLDEKEKQTSMVLGSVLIGGYHQAWSETLAHAFNVTDRSITGIVRDGFEHAFDGAPKEEKSEGSRVVAMLKSPFRSPKARSKKPNLAKTQVS
jgi:hypothetical protein